MRKTMSAFVLLSTALISQLVGANESINTLFQDDFQAKCCSHNRHNCDDHHHRTPQIEEVIDLASLVNTNQQLITPGSHLLFTNNTFYSPIDANQAGSTGNIIITRSGKYAFHYNARFSPGFEGKTAIFVTRNGNDHQIGNTYRNFGLNLTVEANLRSGDIISIKNADSVNVQIITSVFSITQIKKLDHRSE